MSQFDDSMRITLSVYTTIALVIGIAVGGITYGCTERDRQYYAAATKCVETGATWVPQGTDKGTCIGGHRP